MGPLANHDASARNNKGLAGALTTPARRLIVRDELTEAQKRALAAKTAQDFRPALEDVISILKSMAEFEPCCVDGTAKDHECLVDDYDEFLSATAIDYGVEFMGMLNRWAPSLRVPHELARKAADRRLRLCRVVSRMSAGEPCDDDGIRDEAFAYIAERNPLLKFALDLTPEQLAELDAQFDDTGTSQRQRGGSLSATEATGETPARLLLLTTPARRLIVRDPRTPPSAGTGLWLTTPARRLIVRDRDPHDGEFLGLPSQRQRGGLLSATGVFDAGAEGTTHSQRQRGGSSSATGALGSPWLQGPTHNASAEAFRDHEDEKERIMKTKTKNRKRSTSKAKHNRQSRVYSFGVHRLDQATRDVLLDQSRLASQLQCALIEVERERRATIDQMRRQASPDYDAAMRRAEELGREIDEHEAILKQRRAKARRRVNDADVKQIIDELKALRSAAWDVVRKAREKAIAGHDVANEERKRRIDERVAAEGYGARDQHARGRVRDVVTPQMFAEEQWPDEWKSEIEANDLARRRCNEILREFTARGLASCVAGLAREQVDASKKHARMTTRETIEGRVGRELKPNPPQAAEDGTVRHKDFSLLPVLGPMQRDSNRNALRRRMVATLRLGKIDVSFPVLVHARKIVDSTAPRGWRAEFLPEDAIIRRAWVLVRNVGGRLRYDLQLTVQREAVAIHERCRRADVVRVRLGWSATEDGNIRVATWEGSDGEQGTIMLDTPPREVDGQTLTSPSTNFALLDCDAIRSHRDDHHNHAKAVLRTAKRLMCLPAWVAEETKYLPLWRNPRNLAVVVGRLRGEALAGVDVEGIWRRWVELRREEGLGEHANLPEAAPTLRAIAPELAPLQLLALWLEWWRRKNLHLRTFEANKRETALRRRKDHYRQQARMLANRYQQVELTEVDLASLARAPGTTEPIEGNRRVADGQRRRAAPSELATSLKQAFDGRPEPMDLQVAAE